MGVGRRESSPHLSLDVAPNLVCVRCVHQITHSELTRYELDRLIVLIFHRQRVDPFDWHVRLFESVCERHVVGTVLIHGSDLARMSVAREVHAVEGAFDHLVVVAHHTRNQVGLPQ